MKFIIKNLWLSRILLHSSAYIVETMSIWGFDNLRLLQFEASTIWGFDNLRLRQFEASTYILRLRHNRDSHIEASTYWVIYCTYIMRIGHIGASTMRIQYIGVSTMRIQYIGASTMRIQYIGASTYWVIYIMRIQHFDESTST